MNSGPRACAAICAAIENSPVGGIGGDKLDFIDADRGILVFAERFLDLLGEILRLGAAHGKGAYQAGKVLKRDFVRKQNAGEPGGGQQLREAALGLAGFERDAIEKKLVVGDAEQKTGVTALGQRLLGVRSRRSRNWPSVRLWFTPYSRVYLIRILRLCRKDRADALRLASVWAALAITASSRVRSVGNKTKRESDPMHDYGGNWNERGGGAEGDTEGQVLWDEARYTGAADRPVLPYPVAPRVPSDEDWRAFFRSIEGSGRTVLARPLNLPEGARVREVLLHYARGAPRFEAMAPSLAISVNQEYSRADRVLHEGDEVGLLPPVSGGSAEGGGEVAGEIRIVRERIDTEAVVGRLQAAGGWRGGDFRWRGAGQHARTAHALSGL